MKKIVSVLSLMIAFISVMFAEEGNSVRFIYNMIEYRTVSETSVYACGLDADFGLSTSIKDIDIYPIVEFEGKTYEVKGIDDRAFFKSVAEYVGIHADLDYFGEDAFAACENLWMVHFNNENIQTIPDGCFRNCKILSKLRLPAKLKELGDGCFEGCESLVSLDLPATIEYIGKDAFRNCSLIEGIYLHGNMEISEGAFAETKSPFMESRGHYDYKADLVFSGSPITVKSYINPYIVGSASIGMPAPASDVKDVCNYAVIPNIDVRQVSLVADKDIRYDIYPMNSVYVNLDLGEDKSDPTKEYALSTPIYAYIDFSGYEIPLDKMMVMYNGRDITSTVVGNRVLIDSAIPYKFDYYMGGENENVNRILILNRDEVLGVDAISANTSSEEVRVYTIEGSFLGNYRNLEEWKTGAQKGLYIVSTNEGNLKVKI